MGEGEDVTPRLGSLAIEMRTGQRLVFDVDGDSTEPAGFVFGIVRSGSSLLNEVTHALAAANNRHFVDVGTPFFQAGVRELDFGHDPALLRLVCPGNIFGGFRFMPSVLAWSPVFERGPKVLMVRDPRDALVSLYFSDRSSHPMPRAGSIGDDLTWRMRRRRARARFTSIDEYVLEHAQYTAHALLAYIPLLHSSTARVIRYEDFVLDKPSLVLALAQHFRWEAPSSLVAEIAQTVDVRPSAEDPTAFVRQVLPGDHRTKLRPATIERLDWVLTDVMRPFGYAPLRPQSGAAASGSDGGPV